jgi:hypothetical protein
MNFCVNIIKEETVSVEWKNLLKDLSQDYSETIKVKSLPAIVENLNIIFNAVFKLSKEKGFYSMSMRDLSKETQLSPGALYSYFSSKDELLEIMQTASLEIFKRIYRSSRPQRFTSKKHEFYFFINFHLELSEKFHDWFIFNFMEVKSFKFKAKKRSLFHENFTQVLLDKNLKGYLREINTEIKDETRTILGMVIKSSIQDFYIKSWKFKQKKISRKKYSEFIEKMIEGFLHSGN